MSDRPPVASANLQFLQQHASFLTQLRSAAKRNFSAQAATTYLLKLRQFYEALPSVASSFRKSERSAGIRHAVAPENLHQPSGQLWPVAAQPPPN